MSEHSPLVDFEFALNQLSGNREILNKLLSKFATDYQDSSATIRQLIIEDKEQARRFVHTLKGVTGNLGIKALHLASKTLETEIKGNDEPVFDQFDRCLTQTLEAINASINGAENPSAQTQETVLSAVDAGAELISALKSNEFIADDRLSSLLLPLPLSDKCKEAIQQAVYELDYPKALSLLEN